MFSQCNQCFTAAKAENKTNQTQMTMQSDTRLFGWRQDLLKLVQKGLVTVVLVGMGKDWGPSHLLALKP